MLKEGVWIMKVLKNKKGAALIAVIIVFVVVMILSTSMFVIFSNNLKQVKAQEYNTQAYYLALSGIELGFSSLMAEDESTGDMLYESFKWDNGTYADIDDDLNNKLTSGDFPLSDTVDVKGNNINITITPVNNGGKREIKIQSLGTLNSTGDTETLTLVIDAENILNRRWE
jgi:type II secretory pathway component PulK